MAVIWGRKEKEKEEEKKANMKSTTFTCHMRVGNVKSTSTMEGWWPDFNSDVT